MEIWNDIKGFEGLYKISSLGNVKSLGNGKSTCTLYKKERLLFSKAKANGYMHVKLNKDGKRYYFSLHRLIATTFLINPSNKKEVNHKDGNKLNNSLANLEWVTTSENQKHAYANGLQIAIKDKDNKQSIKVVQLNLDGTFIKVWDSIKQIKREIGFNTFGIIKCCKKEKKYNTAYGYKWEYFHTYNSN
jgi:hypothetical protein